MNKKDLIGLINTLPDDVEVRVLGGEYDTDMNLSRAIITHYATSYEDFYLLSGDDKGLGYFAIEYETVFAYLDEHLTVQKP